jgi:hypothetical protein
VAGWTLTYALVIQIRLANVVKTYMIEYCIFIYLYVEVIAKVKIKNKEKRVIGV